MKKLVKKGFGGLLIVFLLLVIPFSSAIGTTRYPNPSGVDQDYSNEGRGEFIRIAGEFDFEQFAKNLGGSLGTPIIDDLDNNSISELIIVDEDQVEIYQNRELDIVSVFDFGDIPTDISNILSFDIDGDGFKEIIFVVEGLTDNQLKIFNFSQADGIQLQREFKIFSGTAPSHPMIACRDVNECIGTLTTGTTNNEFNPFTAFHRGFAFDSRNATIQSFTIFSENQGSSDQIDLCSPRDKNIIVKDYDGDGNLEYILSMGKRENSGGGDAEWKIFWLDNTTVELSGSEAENVPELNGCEGTLGLSTSFTSPIVQEVAASESKIEAVIGAQSSNNDFRIFIFSGSDGSKVDEFPEEFTFLEADGTIVSNVMFGQFMPETASNDVCVMGFDTTEDRYELLCGNVLRSPFSHAILEFPTSSLAFNISGDSNEQHHLIHGVQFSDLLQESKDLEEVLSTHGVFELDYSGFDNVLNRIFDLGTTRGVNLGIDLEQFGQDDIISMTDTNIFYFDDKGTNGEAEILDIEYDPCPVNTIIKLNTTMQVTVTARDTNTFALGFDDLNFKTIAYSGDLNAQNRTLPNISTDQITGQAIVIYQPNFDMNKTITNGIIRTEVFDTGNPDTLAVEEQLFSVALAGLEFGDATCTITVTSLEEEIITEADLNISVAAQGNEGLDDFFEGASNEFRVTPLIIVLFLMLGFTIAVLTTGGDGNSQMITMNKIVFALLGNAIIFIIGTIVGAVPFGVLLVVIIFAIIIAGLWFRRALTSENMS